MEVDCNDGKSSCSAVPVHAGVVGGGAGRYAIGDLFCVCDLWKRGFLGHTAELALCRPPQLQHFGGTT